MDEDQILHDVHDALTQALLKHERSMLGKWVVVAETTDENGARGVWTMASLDNLRFETLGLLHDATTRAENAGCEDLLDEDDS